jgi:hypothetical protein
VKALAIDETSRARGHDYVTLAADAVERRVLFVTGGRDAEAIEALAGDLEEHGCPREAIESVSIDMSPAFIQGVSEALPNARITFDKFHLIWHANTAVDKTRRIEQRDDKSLKGMRWSLLKDRSRLKPEAAAELDDLIARLATTRTARAWVYKEQARAILERKQINVVRAMLEYWCTCVMRSKVEPMKEVAALARRHIEGIVAWAQTRQTKGFLEALTGLFQAAKRRARGFTRRSDDQRAEFTAGVRWRDAAVRRDPGTGDRSLARALRRCNSRYTAGITSIDSKGAVIMPPIIGAAMRCITSDPVPAPNMMGNSPPRITATVMAFGRTRSTAPSRIAWCRSSSEVLPAAMHASHACRK